MAKCKYWRADKNLCETEGHIGFWTCPDEQNGRKRKIGTCDFYGPKPKKPKTKSVKAWAWLDLKGNITAATVNKCGSKIRCTITYKVKGVKP